MPIVPKGDLQWYLFAFLSSTFCIYYIGHVHPKISFKNPLIVLVDSKSLLAFSQCFDYDILGPVLSLMFLRDYCLDIPRCHHLASIGWLLVIPTHILIFLLAPSGWFQRH